MKKKLTNDEKIIGAMDAVDKSVNNLSRYGAKYDEYIDEEAIRGNDVRAKQLISQKIRIYSLIDQLNTLKRNIELGAFTAHAISELGKLPTAISGCKGLLAESPDFTKLGKSITSIFKDIKVSETELAKLNEILNPEPINTISSRLDGVSEEETSDQFKAEYKAMLERIKPRIAPNAVTKPETDNLTSTGNIDYAGIVEEENKKK